MFMWALSPWFCFLFKIEWEPILQENFSFTKKSCTIRYVYNRQFYILGYAMTFVQRYIYCQH